MPRTRIKICGVMRVEDALAAAQLGADAIGIVLYSQSRRFVSRELARQIVGVLPPFVTPVGLFVDEPPQSILDIAAELNLRSVQLQGDETPDEVAELGGVSVIKAIRVDRKTISAELSKWRRQKLSHLAGLVLETANTGLHGGSGVANDWGLVKELQSRGEFEGLPPIIAAGGLKPESVGEVVREIRPYAVDVSSGVESEFGKKSGEKIAAFAEAVHSAM